MPLAPETEQSSSRVRNWMIGLMQIGSVFHRVVMFV